MFWLLWVFTALHGLSLVAATGDYSLVAVCGLLIAVASLVPEHRLYLGWPGFSSCGLWAQQLWLPGSRAQAPQLFAQA